MPNIGCDSLAPNFTDIASWLPGSILSSKSERRAVEVTLLSSVVRARSSTNSPAPGSEVRRLPRSGSNREEGPEFAKRRRETAAELGKVTWCQRSASATSIAVQMKACAVIEDRMMSEAIVTERVAHPDTITRRHVSLLLSLHHKYVMKEKLPKIKMVPKIRAQIE